MNRMVVQSRIGADGILNIALPIGKADADREVQVTVDPVGSSPMTQEEWRNFVLSTAGSITDSSFVRHEQNG
jgi:predicted secreted protein